MTPVDDLLIVDTPENVSFDFEIAGIGSRFLAAIVDTSLILLLQILAFVVGLVLLMNFEDLSGVLSELSNEYPAWALAIAGLISFFFLWGYYIFFETLWNGQSPGKRMAKLRVICLDGRPITLSESLVRNLVRLVDFMPIFYATGVVTMFIQTQSRRLGDLAAGTLVVREKGKKFNLDSLETSTNLKNLPTSVDLSTMGLPLERLDAGDIQMVEDFLRRTRELGNARMLSMYILNHLWKKMDLPLESIPHENYVDVLAAIYNFKKDDHIDNESDLMN